MGYLPRLPCWGDGSVGRVQSETGYLLPNGPGPPLGNLLALALAPAGSSRGADDEPYKLYHLGAGFLANLLG